MQLPIGSSKRLNTFKVKFQRCFLDFAEKKQFDRRRVGYYISTTFLGKNKINSSLEAERSEKPVWFKLYQGVKQINFIIKRSILVISSLKLFNIFSKLSLVFRLLLSLLLHTAKLFFLSSNGIHFYRIAMSTLSVQTLERDNLVKKMSDTERNTWLYCSAFAICVPILIPTIQFGLIFRIWDQYNKPVNREQCSCSCWDTVFKGNNLSLLKTILKTVFISNNTIFHLPFHLFPLFWKLKMYNFSTL